MSTWKVIATALCILILILVAGHMSGCSSQESEETRYTAYERSKIINGFRFTELVDKDTGVHYLVVDGGYGCAVSPMYNADGTIKTEEVKQ